MIPVMLAMVSGTEPANVERLRVVVVMGMRLASADFTRPTRQPAVSHGIANGRMRRVLLWMAHSVRLLLDRAIEQSISRCRAGTTLRNPMRKRRAATFVFGIVVETPQTVDGHIGASAQFALTEATVSHLRMAVKLL